MVQSVRVSVGNSGESSVNFSPVLASQMQALALADGQLLDTLAATVSVASAIWALVLPRLRSELGGDAFKAWIEPLRVCDVDMRSVTIGAPNTYAVSRLTTDYLHRMQARWSSFDPLGRRIRLIVADGIADAQGLACAPLSDSEDETIPLSDPIELSATARTFANYEVGEANRVAVAIAKRVSEEPSNGDVVYFQASTAQARPIC
jgi:chromosomal replication initiator protein